MLDFFRTGRGDLVPGDLGEIVRETARSSEAEALAAKVKIELELVPSPPPVMMSPNAILQVTRNLVGNAIQATPPGGLIRLSTRVNAKTGMVEAAVEDEGAGLKGKTRDRIFEPFFTTKPDGIGLGLAISREIAVSHRGDLRAENRRGGRGAVFTLSLPIGQNGALP